MAWEGLSEKLVTERRSEGSEGTSQGKRLQAKGMANTKSLAWEEAKERVVATESREEGHQE